MEGHPERHVLYERMAEQYLQRVDPGKALENALKAIKCKRDSFKAHWLMGRAFISLTMYKDGIKAFSTALELCCLEDKRQEILIDVLVHHCSRRNRGRLDIMRNISSTTWATVAYDLTKAKLFSEAHTAYLQLKSAVSYDSNTRVNLKPLCDVDTLTNEVWILDLITCLLRHGSDYNTMTSHPGDTYLHVVVRMTLVTGEMGLLQYMLEHTLRQEKLDEMLDCLGNTALHMAAQYPKCSPLTRLEVMQLLGESGVDETLRNSEGKTAAAYLSRSEKAILRCHHEYRSIRYEIQAEEAMEKVNEMYGAFDTASSEEDDLGCDESMDSNIKQLNKQMTERSNNDATASRAKYSAEVTENPHGNSTDLVLQVSDEAVKLADDGQPKNGSSQGSDDQTLPSQFEEGNVQNDHSPLYGTDRVEIFSNSDIAPGDHGKVKEEQTNDNFDKHTDPEITEIEKEEADGNDHKINQKEVKSQLSEQTFTVDSVLLENKETAKFQEEDCMESNAKQSQQVETIVVSVADVSVLPCTQASEHSEETRTVEGGCQSSNKISTEKSDDSASAADQEQNSALGKRTRTTQEGLVSEDSDTAISSMSAVSDDTSQSPVFEKEGYPSSPGGSELISSNGHITDIQRFQEELRNRPSNSQKKTPASNQSLKKEHTFNQDDSTPQTEKDGVDTEDHGNSGNNLSMKSNEENKGKEQDHTCGSQNKDTTNKTDVPADAADEIITMITSMKKMKI